MRFKLVQFSLGIILVLVSSTAGAEVQSSEDASPSFWADRWKNLKSPFTTDAKYIVLAGTAAVGVLLLFEDQLIDQTAEEAAENRIMSTFWSDTADNYGQMYPNAIYFVGMGAYGYLSEDDLAKKRAWMMFEASLYSGASVSVLKEIVHEKRPNPNKTHDSFPSGHTTTAFAFASVVHAEHGHYWGALAYSGALLTAYQRQHNSKHYLHDVVGGATIGAAFGYGLHWANQKNSNVAFSAFPADGGAYGLLRYSF